MKIASIAGNYSKSVIFKSQVSLLEFDVLLINLLDVVNEYRSERKLSQYSTDWTYVDDINHLVRDVYRRRAEINEFLSLGRTIFVCTPPPVRLQRKAPAAAFDLRKELLPVYPKTDIGKGSSIEPVGNSFLKPLYTKYEGEWRYESYYKHDFGRPLLKIKDTNSFVSASVKLGKGNIVFIPNLPVIPFENKEFLDDLINIVSNLNLDLNQTPKMMLPEWSRLIEVPGESDIKQEITKKKDELKVLQSRLETLDSELKSLEALKVLFTGTGTYLENMVNRVFKELGFNVSEGVPGRDDLILEYKDHAAVVEVKGVTKSAAEKHAAQLEKWVSEYIISKERTPKGFLVVNAYRDITLEERNEKAFPDQMMNFSTSRNHCLLTGLDLLAVYFYIQNHPEEKEQVIDELLSTCGHFNKYNWQDYLTLDNVPALLK
ncbi:hypothetical protein ABIC86_003097 [Paenibacillus sp. DS2363]|uniref:hypothetical protein n=1 Tax=unclassified Paenibacillus TaxID=185978 RepID=UPI0030F56E98